jgi:hypothetical protein
MSFALYEVVVRIKSVYVCEAFRGLPDCSSYFCTAETKITDRNNLKGQDSWVPVAHVCNPSCLGV